MTDDVLTPEQRAERGIKDLAREMRWLGRREAARRVWNMAQDHVAKDRRIAELEAEVARLTAERSPR